MTAIDARALYGTDEPPVPARRLKAGALEADLVDGNLRTIRHAGTEVIRAIAYVVRDRDWGTYDLGVADPAVEETPNGFTVSWRAVCTAPNGARLVLDAAIRAEASGWLAFEVTALPDGAFETNRCGFCVLHPIEGVAGRPVAVLHSDNSVEASSFPDLIEPWQPFKDIVAIRHEPRPGVSAIVRMQGDVFEMEDQRAWSDASFKTYVRPLARPWPFTLAAGAANHQRIDLVIEAADGAPAGETAPETQAVDLRLGPATGARFPAFGLLVSPEEAGSIVERPNALRSLSPRHLLLHFDPTAGHGEAELGALARVRALLPGAHAILECVVPCEGDLDAELANAAGLVRRAGLALDAVTVGPSVDRQSTPPGSAWPPCPPLEAVYASARRAFPELRLGGGMFSYFTELNRKRPPIDALDYVTHATCPIVHAADDLSVMQTLEAIPFVTRSARAIVGATKPYHLGPTTIGMRQNPYGSRTAPNPRNKRIAMAANDPRGRGQFAAAWLVGYAARLGEAGLERWTGGAVAGPRGVVADGGERTPAYHVAAGFAALDGLPLLELRSGARGRVDGIALRAEDGSLLLWVANLTPRVQPLVLPEAPGGWTATLLDADAPEPRTLPRPAEGRIALGPYAVALFEGPAAASERCT